MEKKGIYKEKRNSSENKKTSQDKDINSKTKWLDWKMISQEK